MYSIKICHLRVLDHLVWTLHLYKHWPVCPFPQRSYVSMTQIKELFDDFISLIKFRFAIVFPRLVYVWQGIKWNVWTVTNIHWKLLVVELYLSIVPTSGVFDKNLPLACTWSPRVNFAPVQTLTILHFPPTIVSKPDKNQRTLQWYIYFFTYQV